MLKSVVMLIGLSSLAACSLFGGEAAPEPDYRVVLEEGAFEVRDYDALVVVKTTMADGSRSAFGRLFDYISGQNEAERKIAMTAPVLNATADAGTEIAMTTPVFQSVEGVGEMIFVLTKGFTLETAPLPTDPKVSLATLPPRRLAVIRYSGALNAGAANQEARLRAWLETEGLQPDGPAEVAGYNPPWTLPPFRRNEVLIPVRID
ncbi:MAG: heme-binding protein [Rhodobiaceae bacterium]|jgi:hypothetical protein|nr:heme-binding protein [Rhodobiaceae bacterium]